MSTDLRQGIEKSTFQDADTGREIWRLTNHPYQDRHAYYDICPWSPDGRHIVFSSAPSESLTGEYGDYLYTDDAVVYLMDARTFDIRPLAEGAFYQTHVGSMCMWHPDGRSVFCYAPGGQSMRIDVASGEKTIVDGKARQISPDGRTIVGTYGRQDESGKPPGIYMMEPDGTNPRMVLSTEAIYDITPNRDRFRPEHVLTGNTKWSSDGSLLLFTIWIRPMGDVLTNMPGVRRSLYVCEPDGSNPRWISYFGHHHSWTPDGRSVLFCDWLDPETKSGPRLFLVDADGSNRRVVVDEDLGAHPIMSPSLRHIVTWDEDGLILVDIEAQRTEYLTTFERHFDQSHTGIHPHPTWNTDGTQIIYNTGEFGSCEICIVPFET